MSRNPGAPARRLALLVVAGAAMTFACTDTRSPKGGVATGGASITGGTGTPGGSSQATGGTAGQGVGNGGAGGSGPVGCLDGPDGALPRPPGNALPCDLVPPGLRL